MPGPEAAGADRRLLILEYVRWYCQQYGKGPAVRDVADAAGLRSTAAAHRHLRRLEADGFIKMPARQHHSITVINPAPDGWTR